MKRVWIEYFCIYRSIACEKRDTRNHTYCAIIYFSIDKIRQQFIWCVLWSMCVIKETVASSVVGFKVFAKFDSKIDAF